jgi:hypothetical protein
MSEATRDKYAAACMRIAEEVADALIVALGKEWAEWGEGGLAGGVRLLAQQRDRMTLAAQAASSYVPEPERTNFRREYSLGEVTP